MSAPDNSTTTDNPANAGWLQRLVLLHRGRSLWRLVIGFTVLLLCALVSVACDFLVEWIDAGNDQLKTLADPLYSWTTKRKQNS